MKGVNQDFYNLPTAPQTVSNTYAQVAQVQITYKTSSANYVPLGAKEQLSY